MFDLLEAPTESCLDAFNSLARTLVHIIIICLRFLVTNSYCTAEYEYECIFQAQSPRYMRTGIGIRRDTNLWTWLHINLSRQPVIPLYVTTAVYSFARFILISRDFWVDLIFYASKRQTEDLTWRFFPRAPRISLRTSCQSLIPC